MAEIFIKERKGTPPPLLKIKKQSDLLVWRLGVDRCEDGVAFPRHHQRSDGLGGCHRGRAAGTRRAPRGDGTTRRRFRGGWYLQHSSDTASMLGESRVLAGEVTRYDEGCRKHLVTYVDKELEDQWHNLSTEKWRIRSADEQLAPPPTASPPPEKKPAQKFIQLNKPPVSAPGGANPNGFRGNASSCWQTVEQGGGGFRQEAAPTRASGGRGGVSSQDADIERYQCFSRAMLPYYLKKAAQRCDCVPCSQSAALNLCECSCFLTCHSMTYRWTLMCLARCCSCSCVNLADYSLSAGRQCRVDSNFEGVQHWLLLLWKRLA